MSLSSSYTSATMAIRLTTKNVLLISCMVLLIFVVQSSASCRKLRLVHRISRHGCQTRQIPSYGCRGSCPSYSRVSPTNYLEMERHCECCQESGQRTVHVSLRCNDDRGQFNLVVETQVPRSCMCRPCNIIEDVPDFVRLEDLN